MLSLLILILKNSKLRRTTILSFSDVMEFSINSIVMKLLNVDGTVATLMDNLLKQENLKKLPTFTTNVVFVSKLY